MLSLALLVMSQPGAWEPLPRPVIATNVEATLSEAAPMTRSRAVQIVRDAVELATGATAVSLPATVLSVCGEDRACRLKLARESGSDVLVTFYVSGTANHLSFDLEVRSTTTASNARDSVITALTRPWSIDGPAPFPADAEVRDWLSAKLEPLRRKSAYVDRALVELHGLPAGTRVRAGDATTTVETAPLSIARQPRQSLVLQVEPPDYDAFEVTLEPDDVEVVVAAARLVPTTTRRARQVVFWSGVAMVATGVALATASALRPVGTCVYTTSLEPCEPSVPLGTDALSRDLLVPIAAGVGAAGIAIASEPLWRSDGNLESGIWSVVAGLALAALTTGIVYAVEPSL
jgi:hypothetical protein